VKRETYINIHFEIKLAPEFFDAKLIFCITFPDKLAEVLVVRFPQLGFNVKFQLLVMTRLAPEAEVLQAWRRRKSDRHIRGRVARRERQSIQQATEADEGT
jgi:hypothetical protein